MTRYSTSRHIMYSTPPGTEADTETEAEESAVEADPVPADD